jgi:trehalose-6-phosphatase
MDIHTLPEANPGWAWFLDVDGTLVEIAQHPDAVSVGGRVLATIESLARAASGALALISGRTVADLDRLFSPLHMPCAGLHGLERRDAAGRLHIAGGPSPALDLVAEDSPPRIPAFSSRTRGSRARCITAARRRRARPRWRSAATSRGATATRFPSSRGRW